MKEKQKVIGQAFTRKKYPGGTTVFRYRPEDRAKLAALWGGAERV